MNYPGTVFYGMALLPVVFLINSCIAGDQLSGRRKAVNQQSDTSIIDNDGNRYGVKTFRDNKQWLVSNLKLIIPHSYHYNDSAKYDEHYGRLYSWEAAQKGCASLGQGWRLPEKEDWYQLAENYGAIGRVEPNIEKRAFLPLLKGGNSQFNALLGGGRNPAGDYARLDAHGFYWTATQHDSATAWFANFAKGSQALYIQPEGEKVRAFSVRCAKK
jgi:uncharacterized protein (TIGR02145 family)